MLVYAVDRTLPWALSRRWRKARKRSTCFRSKILIDALNWHPRLIFTSESVHTNDYCLP